MEGMDKRRIKNS